MANPLSIYADRAEDVGPFASPGSTMKLAEFLKQPDMPGNDFEAETKSQVEISDKFSRGVVAAYRQNRLANFTSSQDAAMAEAADHRIKTVQDQTGVVLENPFRDGYFREATQRMDAAGGAGNLQDNRYAGLIAEQRRIFDEKMAEVATNFPDKAQALQFFQPIEDQAKAITQGAEYDGDHAEGGLLAAFVGGAAAAARDPLQMVALLATGGESVAGTALARIGWTALRQGLQNAGIAAIEQPSVQEWRREAGIRSGVVPSIENIGMNFVIGGALGGAVHGGVELARAEKQALIRVAIGAGQPGDIEIAAKGLGVTIDADTGATIKAAEADLAHATAARDTPPDGLPAGAGIDLERQAIRHAENPVGEPPPSLASPAAVQPDVPAAERVMAQFEARPIDGVAALRGSPDLIEGALHSDLPDVVQSGRLASLSDDAWSMVAEGRAPPEHGIIAGELSPDPSFDAVILSRLADAGDVSPAEARLIAADAIEREAARRERATIDVIEPAPINFAIDQSKIRDALANGERVDGAAIKIGDKIYRGHNHTDALDRAAKDVKMSPEDFMAQLEGHDNVGLDGFTTTDGRFLTRTEAYALQDAIDARDAGSLPSAVTMPDGTARDVIDLVPMLRDDGTVLLATPEAVAVMADQQAGLANLVRACNL